MEAKMTCPHCGGRISFASEEAGAAAPCPHCGARIVLVIPIGFNRPPSAPAPIPSSPKIIFPATKPAAPEKPNPAKQIRSNAETVGGLGVFLIILGFVAVGAAGLCLFSITSQSGYYDSDVNKTLFIGGGIAGACFWLAAVMLIIGQLLHLRANTHRDL